MPRHLNSDRPLRVAPKLYEDHAAIIQEFEEAVRAHEMLRSRPASEHQAIEDFYLDAKMDLMDMVAEFCGLPTSWDISARPDRHTP